MHAGGHTEGHEAPDAPGVDHLEVLQAVAQAGDDVRAHEDSAASMPSMTVSTPASPMTWNPPSTPASEQAAMWSRTCATVR